MAGIIAASVVSGVIAVGSVPVVLGVLGFTGAGIAAGSFAAGMISTTATANRGTVAAGSLVPILQPVAAAGLSLSSKLMLGSAVVSAFGVGLLLL